jgi:hypothetical protein
MQAIDLRSCNHNSYDFHFGGDSFGEGYDWKADLGRKGNADRSQCSMKRNLPKGPLAEKKEPKGRPHHTELQKTGQRQGTYLQR